MSVFYLKQINFNICVWDMGVDKLTCWQAMLSVVVWTCSTQEWGMAAVFVGVIYIFYELSHFVYFFNSDSYVLMSLIVWCSYFFLTKCNIGKGHSLIMMYQCFFVICKVCTSIGNWVTFLHKTTHLSSACWPHVSMGQNPEALSRTKSFKFHRCRLPAKPTNLRHPQTFYTHPPKILEIDLRSCYGRRTFT